MTEASRLRPGKSQWAILALAGLIAVAVGTALAPAAGQAKNCITDAELETAVGDQLRSGTFAINTSKLREAPMCSGLTVAQAIQRLGERLSPRASAGPQAAQSQPRSGPEAADRQPSLPSATSAELLAYADKDHWTKVKGRTFFEHPTVVSGLRNAGVTPAVRKAIDAYQVSTAITRQSDVLLDRGCIPHNCDTYHYRLFVNAGSGNAALCLFDGGPDAKWYFGGGSTPLAVRGRNCKVDSLAQVPAEVSRALATGTAGIAARQPTAGAASASGTGADLGGLLAFTAPAKCEIDEPYITFISDLADYPGDVADTPQLGKVTVPPAYRSLVGSPVQKRFKDGLNIRVPIRGQWHGIPVVALEGHYWNGGDPGGHSIIMQGRLQDARTRLNRAGFNIPPSGRRTIPRDYEMEISLVADGGEISFTCM